MNRIELIRKEEKKYHDSCYENYKLFEEGSWLHKPVKTVIDLIPLFMGKDNLKILDLGSGVGRNSIPLAEAVKEKGGKVICVDLLDSALQKLIKYSEKFNVKEVIQAEKADIGNYDIKPKYFDLIVAVSSLEHVQSELIFEKVVQQMAEGTKYNGINCIIVNSEVEEIDLANDKKLDALMEINISTHAMISKLKKLYNDWELLDVRVKPLKYNIVRDQRSILLKSNAITYIVRNNNL
ncbi:class I SAM-dependent methyltransferase [Bacillus sp. FSL K6-3431]|uniref:class I SAM-dependent methyltransferase n=1 Tax=Bacillus sp. FSL K6-3431 TaxID=2921500 RepID=UPI0030FBDBF2